MKVMYSSLGKLAHDDKLHVLVCAFLVNSFVNFYN